MTLHLALCDVTCRVMMGRDDDGDDNGDDSSFQYAQIPICCSCLIWHHCSYHHQCEESTRLVVEGE